MKQIDRTIKSQSEPKDLNVFWLDTSNPEEPILKEYDGGWKAVAGGGGSTGNAVSYDEQTLTDAQKMQARKNQGLYYSEGGGEDVTLTWDGDTTGLERVEVNQGVIMYKVSDDAPQKELVKSLGMTIDGVEQIIDISQQGITPIEGGYAMGEGFVIVITESEGTASGLTFTKGIWFVKGVSTGNYVSKFTYGATETVHHIEPKYIKDMYYEETTGEEKTVLTPNDPNYEWQYPDNYWLNGGIEFGWVCEDTPAQNDIISIRFSDSENYIQGSELSSTIIQSDDMEGGPIILYEVNSSDSARKKFFVVINDVSVGGLEPKKGIYVPKLETYADPYIREINYNSTTTTVHQIPEKYIPSTQTVPAVKIEVPSQNSEYYNIGHTVLNNWVRSRDVKFSVDIEGFHLSWLSIVDMSDPTNTIEGEMDSDTYTFTSAGSYLVILNLVDSGDNSRDISAILVVIDIGS